MAHRPIEPDHHTGVHRGIHYALKPNAAPGFWRYAYAIDDKVRSGRVQGRLPQLAIRRVQMRIDRDMRSGRTDGGAPGSRSETGLANGD